MLNAIKQGAQDALASPKADLVPIATAAVAGFQINDAIMWVGLVATTMLIVQRGFDIFLRVKNYLAERKAQKRRCTDHGGAG